MLFLCAKTISNKQTTIFGRLPARVHLSVGVAHKPIFPETKLLRLVNLLYCSLSLAPHRELHTAARVRVPGRLPEHFNRRWRITAGPL